MSANPHANGGELLRDLMLPDFRDYAVDVPSRTRRSSEPMRVLGGFLRDVVVERIPTTSAFSGRTRPRPTDLEDVFAVTAREWSKLRFFPTDEGLAPEGRVLEILSEHLCQGWLEGYLLTGRHGVFNCYEAFIHIVDSMFNQHAKWLKVTREHPVATADRLAQLPAQLPRVASGSQRLLAPGSRVHRPRREQESRDHPRISAAGRQHASLRRRSLLTQPELRQRRRRRRSSRR